MSLLQLLATGLCVYQLGLHTVASQSLWFTQLDCLGYFYLQNFTVGSVLSAFPASRHTHA